MSRTKFDVKPVSKLDPHIGLLLSMLDEGTWEWRDELAECGNIGTNMIRWQPFPEGHSIGAVILHIIDVEAFWLHELAAGQPVSAKDSKTFMSEETQQYAGRWPVPHKKPLKWYFEQHDRIRQKTHQFVKQINDPLHAYTRPKTARRPQRTFTLRWILHHVITHEAYHAGQVLLLAMQYAKRKQR